MFSAIGDGFYYIVFLTLAKSLPDAALIITLITLAKKLPFALGIVAGMVADKVIHRARLMIIVNVVRAVIFVAMAGLLVVGIRHYILSIFLLIVLLDGICDIIGAVSTKMYPAFIKYSVSKENLAHAQGTINGLIQSVSLFSSAIGAILVTYFAAYSLALFNGFLFFLSALVIIYFRKPMESTEEKYIRPTISASKMFNTADLKKVLKAFSRPDFKHILIFMVACGIVLETVIAQATLLLSTKAVFPIINFQISVFFMDLAYSLGMIFGSVFLTKKLQNISYSHVIPFVQIFVLLSSICLIFDMFIPFYVFLTLMAITTGLFMATLFGHYAKHIPTAIFSTFIGFMGTIQFAFVLASISIFNAISATASFTLSLSILMLIWIIFAVITSVLHKRALSWAKMNNQTLHFSSGNKSVLYNTDSDTMIDFPRGIFSNNKTLRDKGIQELLKNSNVFANDRTLAEKNYQNAQKNTLQLGILVHENCNFRCIYCYEKFEKNLITDDTVKGIMNFVDKELKKGNYKALSIGWFGGEPLLAKDKISEMSVKFMAMSEKYGAQYYSHVTTNGYTLDSKTQEMLLPAGITNFQITVDGDKEYHDKQRVLTNGAGTFDTIWSNLQKMSSLQGDWTVNVRVNISGENYQDMHEFIEKFNQTFGDDKRFVISFHNVNYWSDNNISTILKKDVSLELYKYASKRGVNVIPMRWLVGPCTNCYASDKSSYIIGSDTTVYKCTVALYDESNQLGKILPDGTMEIDSIKEALWTESQWSNHQAKCEECQILNICQGARCPYKNILASERKCPTIKDDILDYVKIMHDQEGADYSLNYK